MVIPSNLGFKVSTRTIDYREMVIEQWGVQWRMPDIAYDMKNGRKFECTDAYQTGIYKQN